MSVSAPRVAWVLLLSVAVTGCAWANRENRVVWNAFEEQLVPEDDTWFAVTLPLTIPGGVLAILLDTFIVHPGRVADDALGDTGDRLWSDSDWEQHYYTEMAWLPGRVLFSPLVFASSWLSRSLFDMPAHRSVEQRGQDRDSDEQELLGWLEALARGQVGPAPSVVPSAWSAALASAYEGALAGTTSLGRLRLYRFVQRNRLPPWTRARALGLDDPDPVVRYLLLTSWPGTIPDDVIEALRVDPNPAVREAARAVGVGATGGSARARR